MHRTQDQPQYCFKFFKHLGYLFTEGLAHFSSPDNKKQQDFEELLMDLWMTYDLQGVEAVPHPLFSEACKKDPGRRLFKSLCIDRINLLVKTNIYFMDSFSNMHQFSLTAVIVF